MTFYSQHPAHFRPMSAINMGWREYVDLFATVPFCTRTSMRTTVTEARHTTYHFQRRRILAMKTCSITRLITSFL